MCFDPISATATAIALGTAAEAAAGTTAAVAGTAAAAGAAGAAGFGTAALAGTTGAAAAGAGGLLGTGISTGTALSLASGATAAGSSLLTFQGQQANADAQNASWIRNQGAALVADKDNQNALTQRELQEAGANSQRLQAANVDAARREAEAVVSGASSGTGGIALKSIVQSIGRQAEENRVAQMMSWNNTVDQIQAQKSGVNATYTSRVNAVPTVQGPTPLAPVLGTGGAALRYFADQYKQDRQAGDGGVGLADIVPR